MSLRQHVIVGIISLVAGINAANAQYCVPAPGTVSSCGTAPLTVRINSVSTTNATTNVVNNNNTCSGYTYYSGAGNTIVANAGANINITVNTQQPGTLPAVDPIRYPYRIVVWVDWNRDGVFDNTKYNPLTFTGERMVVSPTTGYLSGNFISSFPVPLSAKNGLTRMRVRAGTRSGAFAPYVPPDTLMGTHPCLPGDYVHGEVEDYDFEVINPCREPLKITYSNLTSTTATVKWTRRPNAVKYEYWISTVQAVPEPGTGNYLTTDTVVNLLDVNIPLTCGTRYYVYVRSICDDTKNQANWEYSPWKMDYFDVPQCCYMPEANINNISSTTAVASWVPVPTVQQYEYAINSSPVPPISGNITTATSVLLQGLAPGTQLYFFLRAHCSPTPLSSWGLDSFLTQPTTGIGNISNAKGFSLTAYPNPAKDKVTITVVAGTRADNGIVEITDITGKVLVRAKMENDTQDIDIAGQPAGIYLIRYRDDKNNSVIKLNKE